jgi:glucose dehydrogenase
MPLDVLGLTAMVITAEGVAFLSRTLDSNLRVYDKRTGAKGYGGRVSGFIRSSLHRSGRHERKTGSSLNRL